MRPIIIITETGERREARVYTVNAEPDPSPSFNTEGTKNLFTLSKVDLHKYPKQIKRTHTPILC